MTPEDVGAGLQKSMDEYETWSFPCGNSSLTIQTEDDPDGRVRLKVSTAAEWPDREPYIDFCKSIPRSEAGATVTQVIDDAIRRHCMTRELINPVELMREWVIPEDVPVKYDDIFSRVGDMTVSSQAGRPAHTNLQPPCRT